jgi:hypothetical protein
MYLSTALVCFGIRKQTYFVVLPHTLSFLNISWLAKFCGIYTASGVYYRFLFLICVYWRNTYQDLKDPASFIQGCMYIGTGMSC